MHPLLEKHKNDFDQVLTHLQNELATLRIGRANPLLVENILVEAYGSKMPIKQLASISVSDARTLLIQPWDKTHSKEIEKAISAANIGISPVNEGAQLRLTVPQLTEESRLALTKSVSEKIEKGRIALRQIRDGVRDEIIEQERAKAITQDDKFDLQKKLDDRAKEYNEKIKQLGEKKEQEILTF